MNHRIIVADNFFPEAQANELWQKLQTANYTDQQGPDGVVYQNICTDHQPENAAQLLAGLHNRIEPVDLKLSCFRLAPDGDKDDTFCHADGIYANWAAVVYMNLAIRHGGTAFWTNKHTGLDAVPNDELLKVAGFNLNDWHTSLTEMTKDPRNWNMQGFVGMKFNRAVTYPTAMFHSRVPNDITAPFGPDAKTGRLIWVAFYNL